MRKDVNKGRKYSRERYWKVIKSDPVLWEKYKKKTKQRVSEWRKRNPQKVKAQRIVFVALRNGSIKKAPCFCGATKVEAHHSNYRKPLEILWLCKVHHRKADMERRSKLSTV